MNVIEKKEYIYSNHTGDAVMTVYKVFPGIEIVYNAVHMDRFERGETQYGKYIEIQHCKEGRMEQDFRDESLYLMPGDFSIAIRDRTSDAYHFPLHHYHGITIAINTDITPKNFADYLNDVFVEPMKVAEKFCGEKEFGVIRGEKYIEHIFAELYSAPEQGRIGYFKVKIMELFLTLNGIDSHLADGATHSIPRSNVTLAKQVAQFLSEHYDQRITIPELAKRFSVSGTHLKTVFKDVYGVPIYSYVRINKMQLAAQLLINSECSIMQIANDFGYTNGSKFTIAFREIMGETPSDYRKIYTKKQT